MNAKDLPVRINAASAGTEYDLTTRVPLDEVGYVVNA